MTKYSKREDHLAIQRREIEILSLIRHPNVVKMIDWFEDIDSFYLVTEHL